MDRFVALLESESCTNLLLALSHTLWQGALAAGILFVYLRQTSAEDVNKRYIAAVAALGAVVLSALLTWSILSYKPTGTPVADAAPMTVGSGPVAMAEPVAVRNAVSATPVVPPSRTMDTRQVWLVQAWLAGVALMSLRIVTAIVGGGRLRSRCRPLEDPETLTLIEQLRDSMGIGRSIRVLVGERITIPGVIGCFWPTLLLPASMLSGIPVADLQAILAHELAHIKRYDYLVHFLQMVVEALLFFNPAVWWISRQVRIEREACCDAAGVQWTGQRTKYAEALVAWAHRIGTPAPAVGFGDRSNPGSLLDRVHRVLIAGHRPRPRVPWHVATAMVVLSLACLALIGQATGMAVAVAGRILTPQERIDRIAAIFQQDDPKASVEFSGVVRTYDGSPLPADTKLHVRWRHFHPHTTSHRVTNIVVDVSKEGFFQELIAVGRFDIMTRASGYAPTFAGPFEAEPGSRRIEGIELVLHKGFTGRIQLVDEAGQAVPDAHLAGGYPFGYNSGYLEVIDLTTDADGIATLEHATSEGMTLAVKADGFEVDRVHEITFIPDEIRVMTLTRAQPTTGLVLEAATGRPIEGAEIQIIETMWQTGYSTRHQIGHATDAVTDVQGTFALNSLRSDSQYLLFIRAPGYQARLLPGVEAGASDIVVPLGPRKTIRGRITGDLSLLNRDAVSGNPFILATSGYQHTFFSHHHDARSRIPVTIRDGIGYFEIDDFWGQTVTLFAGFEQIHLNVEEDRLDDIVIDLNPTTYRQVVLRFQVPEGAPPIEGGVRIEHFSERGRPQSVGTQGIDIEDNEASCVIPVPSRLKWAIDFRPGKRPAGYWFHGGHGDMRIEPGEGPFVIDVPVYPGGIIHGSILRPDGNLATRASAYVTVGEDNLREFRRRASDAAQATANRGRFTAAPLPLGGRYAVVAREDYAFVMSDSFLLDERNPIVNVDLQLPQGIDVEGYLLDAEGAPVRCSVSLWVSIKQGEHFYHLSISGVQNEPDETGRFVFENVNPGPGGACFIDASGRPGYRGARREITDRGSPVVIQLERGHRVVGTVVEDATGWPVPEVLVHATSADGPQGNRRDLAEHLWADGMTDAQGRFVFSTMAADYYRLHLRGMLNLADPERPIVVQGGQAEPVTIRVTIPPGSYLKAYNSQSGP